jgi:21S rRNA (GM2251-2'-O)-methyltransferase
MSVFASFFCHCLLQQNLGAMLRSAYCLGASGVIGCSRNCAPLTPVVSKASAGAAELMPLHSCR